MKRTIQRQKLELARRTNKWKMQLWGRRSESLQWPKSKHVFLFDQSKLGCLKGLCIRISLFFFWSSNHHLFPLTADQKQMASFISEASSMSLGGLIDPMLFPRLLKFQNYLTSFTCSSRELTVVVENPEKKSETEGGCVSILCIADWKAHHHEIVLQHFWEKCQCSQLGQFFGILKS